MMTLLSFIAFFSEKIMNHWDSIVSDKAKIIINTIKLLKLNCKDFLTDNLLKMGELKLQNKPCSLY